MTRTIDSAFRTALVLGITLGAAGSMTAIISPLTATQAHAFGLGDITGAAKDWGTSAASGIKRAGESVSSAAKKSGKVDVVGAVKEAATDWGTSAVDGIKRAGKSVGRAAEDAYDHNLIRTAINPTLFPILGSSGASCGDVGRIGKVGCDFVPRGVSPTPAAKPTPPATGPGSWGGPPKNPGSFNGPIKGVPDTGRVTRKGPATGFANKSLKLSRGNEIVPIKRGGRGTEVVPIRKGSDAPVQGITRENLKPGRGRKAKVTLQKGQLGNDRSTWGRPVGGTKKPVSRDRSVMGRPTGITKANVKSQQKAKRITRDNRKSTRDLSRNNSHDDRRLRIKHHDNKGQANRRSNKNSSGGSKRKHVRNFNQGSSKQLRIRR